jgi:hypothetical protein
VEREVCAADDCGESGAGERDERDGGECCGICYAFLGERGKGRVHEMDSGP